MCCLVIPPIPIASEEKLTEKPKITYALLTLEGLAFLATNILRGLNGMDGFEIDLRQTAFEYLGYIPNEKFPWTFVTYAFLHDGWIHLLGNLLFLWIFGSFLEQRLGPSKYLAVLVLGSVSACVGHDLALTTLATGTSRSYHLPLVGASGYISAIMGAFLVLLPQARVKCFYAILFLFFFHHSTLSLPAAVYIPIFVLWGDLFSLLYHGAETQTAHGAHLGGAVFGLVFGLFVRYTPKTQKAIDRDLLRHEQEAQSLVRLAHENFRKAIGMKALEAALALVREGEREGRPLPLTFKDRLDLAALLQDGGQNHLAALNYRNLLASDIDHDQRLEIGLRLAKILLVYERDLEATKSLLRTLYQEFKSDPRLPEILKLIDQVKETERNLFKRPR